MPLVSLEKVNFPVWCEVKQAGLFSLQSGEEKTFHPAQVKEMLLVCSGQLLVETDSFSACLREGSYLIFQPGEIPPFRTKGLASSTRFLRATGNWQALSGAGLFTVRNGKPPVGDSPYQYWKTTTCDNHYHDSDAYWVILQGRCRVASEGKFYEVKPGDCVVTGRGWHHDIVSLIYDESVTVAWITGTLEGKKRPGHLHEPTHGPAEPDARKV